MDLLIMNDILKPIIIIVIFLSLIITMIFVYRIIKIWIFVLFIFLISLILGISTLSLNYIPFNPYTSTFFILTQLLFLIVKTIKVFKR